MWIALPHGGRAKGFDAEELVTHVATLQGCIIQGQQVCVLADHTKPLSLDYWLRTHHSATPDTKQAVNSVMEALAATGWFSIEKSLICPTSGRRCKGLALTEAGWEQAHG